MKVLLVLAVMFVLLHLGQNKPRWDKRQHLNSNKQNNQRCVFEQYCNNIKNRPRVGKQKHSKNYKNQPCRRHRDIKAYEDFVSKHILDRVSKPGLKFNRTSNTSWQTYLQDKNLCEGRPKQSFFKATDGKKVKAICGGRGLQLVYRKNKNYQNLCISKETINMYYLEVDNNCTVKVVPKKEKVIVGCDKVENKCLPVHFEAYAEQKASTIPCR